jgi:uncharacterized protein (DUF305 family)
MRTLSFLVASVLFFSCADEDANGDHEAHDTTQVISEDQKMSQLSLIMHHMDGTMQNAEITGIPDVDFANMMRIHHQSAVEMADIANAQGKHPEVKSLAAQMKADQQAEIAIFDSILNGNTGGTPSEKFSTEFKASIKNMDHSTMKQETMLDREFLQLMIPHHQGAIDMAKAYLPYAKNAQLKKIAENIVSSQQAEIEKMQHLLTDIK